MRITEFDVIEWLHESVKHRVILEDGVVHVSEVTTCLRKSFYARTRAFRLTPGEAVILLGSRIHDAIQEVLAGRGFEPEFEVAVKRDGVKLVGHIDAYHPDENTVLEFKTVKRVPKEPYRSHKLQASIYGAIVEADDVYVIYISRSDGHVKVFRVGWDPGVLDFAVRRAKLLLEYLSVRKPPTREPSHLCNYCPFRFECRIRMREGGGHERAGRNHKR